MLQDQASSYGLGIIDHRRLVVGNNADKSSISFGSNNIALTVLDTLTHISPFVDYNKDGIAYIDKVGTAACSARFKTTPEFDSFVRKNVFGLLDGAKGDYSPTQYNCRHFSNNL